MTGVGGVAGASYALSIMVFLGGLRESFLVTCFAGIVGGAVAAITWTVMQERHVQA
jgi:ABC-type Fe3+-siderophore transport system permease subunit